MTFRGLGYTSQYLEKVNLAPQIQDGVLNTENAFVVYDFLLNLRYLMSKQNSKGHTYVFEVEHFSDDVNTTTVKPEVVISHVAAQVDEQFQRLYRCFQGWPV